MVATCCPVIASEAKQSRADYATLDCRVALLLAMTKSENGQLVEHLRPADRLALRQQPDPRHMVELDPDAVGVLEQD